MGIEKKGYKDYSLNIIKIRMGIDKKSIVTFQGKEYVVRDIVWAQDTNTWMNYRKLYVEPDIEAYPWGINEALVKLVIPKENIGNRYMFQTFRLRYNPPAFDTEMPERKWRKLPSFEWSKYVMVDLDGQEVPYNWNDALAKKQKKKYVDYYVHKNLWKERNMEQLSNTNCGIPCGKINDIWVLDLDFYGDKYNPETCKFLQQFGNVENYIKKNNLYAVKTISGGIHIYFTYDPMMKQTQNEETCIDIRNDGGYVVSPHTEILGNRYEILNHGDIIECPKDLKDFVIKNVLNVEKGTKQYKKINQKVKVVNPITNKEELVEELEVDLDVYEFAFTDYVVNQVCKRLPDKFFHDREYFVKWSTAMKTLNHKDIWKKWARKRCEVNEEFEAFDPSDIWLDNQWDYIHNHNQLFMVNHILKEAEKNGYKNARTMLDYYKLKPVPGNPFIPDKIINKVKLGHGCEEQGGFFNVEKDKVVIVKSDTGTGKTTEFAQHILNSRKGTRKKPFISIVSRVSLGKEQVRVFRKAGIKCYFHEDISAEIKEHDGWWGQFEGSSIIITIDSLTKLARWNDFEGYTLYLDEYNSLMNYLVVCNLPTMQKNRTLIMDLLRKMINQSDRTICTDADINEISLTYFTQRDIDFTFIKNEYQHNGGVEADEIFSFNKFIKAINKEEKWLICCDSKTNADIISHVNKSKKYMLITSEGVYKSWEDKWTKETPNLDECERVIFSPAIMYGLDSSMERPVFCYFKEHTISPEGMVQQLSRCRNISHLYYSFTSKRWKPYKYHDYEQVLQMVNDQELFGVTTIGKIDPDTGLPEENVTDESYIELRSMYEYREDCMNTNKFAHWFKITKERGFKHNVRFSQTSIKGLKEAGVEVSQIKEEEFIKYCEEYNKYYYPYRNKKIDKLEEKYAKIIVNQTNQDDIDYEMKEHEDRKKELKDDWGEIDDYFPASIIQLNEILRIDYDELVHYKDTILNPFDLRHHFNLTKFMYNDKTKIKSSLDKKMEYGCNKTSTIESKLLTLTRFRGLVGCETIDDDYECKKNIMAEHGVETDHIEQFVNEYRLVYERCKIKNMPDLTDKKKAQQHLVKMYKALFGGDLITKRKSTKMGKSITYYNYDDEILQEHNRLYKFRVDYRARNKNKTDKYMFLDDEDDDNLPNVVDCGEIQ